jgi:hypothetical protein
MLERSAAESQLLERRGQEAIKLHQLIREILEG